MNQRSISIAEPKHVKYLSRVPTTPPTQVSIENMYLRGRVYGKQTNAHPQFCSASLPRLITHMWVTVSLHMVDIYANLHILPGKKCH